LRGAQRRSNPVVEAYWIALSLTLAMTVKDRVNTRVTDEVSCS
jgi:hypothetical protein